jgi:hypothetical protein
MPLPSQRRTRASKAGPDPVTDTAWADARAMRLCADYTAADPRAALCDQPWHTAAGDGSDGPGPLPDALPPLFRAPPQTQERLKVSAGAATLLANVMGVVGLGDEVRDRGSEAVENLIADTESHKLEPPLLSTDPDADVRAAQRSWADPFGWWVRHGGAGLRGPVWPVDERAGEGLAWPQGFEGFCRRTEEDMWREKIGVSRGAAEYLVRILEGDGDWDAGWEPREIEWVGSLSRHLVTADRLGGVTYRDYALATAFALEIR